MLVSIVLRHITACCDHSLYYSRRCFSQDNQLLRCNVRCKGMGGGATSSQGLAFLRPPLVRFSPAWQFSSPPPLSRSRVALCRSCAPASLRASSCTEEASSTKEDHRQDPDQFTGISQSVRTRPRPRYQRSQVPLITCIRARHSLILDQSNVDSLRKRESLIHSNTGCRRSCPLPREGASTRDSLTDLEI